jgi:hypothetical protein
LQRCLSVAAGCQKVMEVAIGALAGDCRSKLHVYKVSLNSYNTKFLYTKSISSLKTESSAILCITKCLNIVRSLRLIQFVWERGNRRCSLTSARTNCCHTCCPGPGKKSRLTRQPTAAS